MKVTNDPQSVKVYLDLVYKCDSRSGRIDLIFETFDELMWADEFDVCDLILSQVDVNQIDCSSTIVAFLTITLPIRETSDARKQYAQQARRRLAELIPERVDRLMKGLE